MARALLPLTVLGMLGLAMASTVDFTSLGANTACRLDTSDSCTAKTCTHTEDEGTYTATKERCMVLCRQWSDCKGIEYETGTMYCEIWKQTVGHFASVNGYECWNYTASTTNSPITMNAVSLVMTIAYIDYDALTANTTAATLLGTEAKTYLNSKAPTGITTSAITVTFAKSGTSTVATAIMPFDATAVSWAKMHRTFSPKFYTTLQTELKAAIQNTLTPFPTSGKTMSDVAITLGPETNVINNPSSSGSNVNAAQGRGPGLTLSATLLLWAALKAAPF